MLPRFTQSLALCSALLLGAALPASAQTPAVAPAATGKTELLWLGQAKTTKTQE
jgi:hypothetical protein